MPAIKEVQLPTIERLETEEETRQRLDNLFTGKTFKGSTKWSKVTDDDSNKPDDNADVTANNTANDTTNVDSVASSTVQPRAQVLWEKYLFIGDYQDALTETVGGTGTVTRSVIDTTINSGNSSAELHSGNMGALNWSNSLEMTCNVKLSSGSADFDTFFGMGEFGGGGTPVSNTSTVRHIGWMTDAGTLVASVANGTTQTKSSTISETLTNNNQYYIDYTAGVSARFYINGTLKATLTTNLPSGNNVQLHFGSVNRTTDGIVTVNNNYFVKFDT